MVSRRLTGGVHEKVATVQVPAGLKLILPKGKVVNMEVRVPGYPIKE